MWSKFGTAFCQIIGKQLRMSLSYLPRHRIPHFPYKVKQWSLTVWCGFDSSMDRGSGAVSLEHLGPGKS